MAKDINIHIKTRGAGQTKQDLQGVGKSAEKVGDSTEKMGEGAQRGGSKILGVLKSLIGPIGFMAIGTAVASAAAKVIKFFDMIKQRSDEAVREVQEIRKAYESLFEAMDAFDEKSRQQVTKTTNLILKETGVTQELGLPVIDEYTRQFKSLVEAGRITQQQYDRGMKEMLGYAARHGGAATTDLISIMRGWEMVTPEQQGAFRRQIAAGAAGAGLRDEDVIEALGRGMPTIKAMGWTPEEAVEKIAVLAAGEVGRKKKSMPATTLQALMAPQLTKTEEYGIEKETAEDPRKLLEELGKKQAEMDRQAFTRMLVDIYGTEAAAGVSKLITAPSRGIRERLRQAAGEAGAEAERAEEKANRDTLERRDAAAKARKRGIKLELTEAEQYMEDVREIGEDRQKRLRINEPVRQYYREFFQAEAAEKEYAAFREWQDQLTEEQRAEIYQEFGRKGRVAGVAPERFYWERMTAKEKYEALIGTQPEQKTTPTPKAAPQPQPEIQPGKQQVKVPVEAGAEQQQINVPVEARAEQQQVNVPVEAGVEQQNVKVPVEAGADRQQVKVPVVAEAEQQEFPIIAPSAAGPGQAEKQVVNNYYQSYNYIYDHSMRFHPRVGDDESGPRIPGGVMV